MIKILSIGNSFSQDAQRYVKDIAAAGGTDILLQNLYIGGCPLKTHWENAKGNAAEYMLEENGADTGRRVSIAQALSSDTWDYVTMQQASHDSGFAETYEPYLTELCGYVRGLAPNAEQVLHQTWAYEYNSTHDGFVAYGKSQSLMHAALADAYSRAAQAHRLRVIPSGELIARLRTLPEFNAENGGQSLCRDGFHLHETVGRYAVGALWYCFFTGKAIETSNFSPASPSPLDPLIERIRATLQDFMRG